MAVSAVADPNAYVRTLEDGARGTELMVKGARCAACIQKIESSLLTLPGVEEARLNLSTSRLRVRWRGDRTNAQGLMDAVNALGFEASAFDPEASGRSTDAEGRGLLVRLAVAGFASMNIMMLSVPIWNGAGEMGEATRALLHWSSALIAIPTALYSGQPFFVSAWTALRKRRANMDVPISLAVFLTLAMSLAETALHGAHAYFDGVVMLLFLLLIGRYFDHRLRQEARTAARDLIAMQATTASRIDANGSLSAIPARDIAIGDRLLIAPGDRMPVNAVIEEGASMLDRAMLTGETTPMAVRAGDLVEAGAINLTARLIVRAHARVEESAVADLARLIEIGEQNRAAYRRVIDKAAALYVPIVHALAFLTFVAWLAAPMLGLPAGDGGVRHALACAVAVLIITCPCALGLAVPAVQVVATGRLFRQGVLIKSGDALERLAQADFILLDKTGTLTLGRPRLVGPVDSATLALAAQLARASRHPLSRALVEAAGPGPIAQNVREHAGEGLEGLIGPHTAKLGSKRFVAPEAQDSGDSGAELWFRLNDAPAARFQFEDAPRPDAAEAIAALKARGFQIELLSGDREDAVAAAARACGLDQWRASMSPQEKAARIDELHRAGRKTLMVGDGLNDAASLALAFVSATPGAAVDVAQAAADIVFQGARLMPIVHAIDVARAARGRVRENLGFSALYNVVAIPFAALGFVTPLIAALAMSGSSLAVTANALRLADRSGRWI